jgi:hypothetical protein
VEDEPAGISSELEGCFEAREASARDEERARFVLTERFSWAIDSLSVGRGAGSERPKRLPSLDGLGRSELLDLRELERPESELLERSEAEGETEELETRELTGTFAGVFEVLGFRVSGGLGER